MTISKTVELCRNTARSKIVKSVLASKSFDTPSEVISKFATENSISRKEFKETEMSKNKQFPNAQKTDFRQQGNRFQNRNNGHFRQNATR